MKKIITGAAVAALVALGAFIAPASAWAGGSDSPTPYTVDQTGITLPAGDTFRDNGHVNITSNPSGTNLHFEGKCITRTDAECAGARHDAAQFIGKSFIPWSAFGLSGEFCVSWVQISNYNEHFGEGGQAPICVTKDKPKPPQPDDKVKYTAWVDGAWGCGDTTVEQTRTKKVWTYEWNAHKKEWVKTGPTTSTETQTRDLTVDEQIPFQSADPEGQCFDRPDAPEPLSGDEQRTGEPVCAVPLDGTAEQTTESRNWTQEPSWNEQSGAWEFGERAYTDWQTVGTETIDSEECAPVIVPPTETPEPPADSPKKSELAVTGSNGFAAWLAGGGLLLAGALLLSRRIIARHN